MLRLSCTCLIVLPLLTAGCWMATPTAPPATAAPTAGGELLPGDLPPGEDLPPLPETPDEPPPAKATKSDAPPREDAKPEDPKPDDLASDRYEFREEHDPEGTGKFYMEREIAPVMGFGAADWLERPEREDEERLTTLVKELKLKPGMVVADIGAGSGRITLMMSPLVGDEGKVLAVDVQQEMLDLLEKKTKEQKIENVELILGTPKSPRLKPATVDLALMVDVYHEFEFPYEMLSEIAKSLKPGGRVLFVEYRKEDRKVPIKEVHKMTVTQVRIEAGLPEFRLKWKETVETLPWQHMIFFERK